MSGLVFLLAVVVISAAGTLVLWWRFREPKAWDWQIHEFRRTLDALSPESPLPGRDRHADPAGARSRGRRAD